MFLASQTAPEEPVDWAAAKAEKAEAMRAVVKSMVSSLGLLRAGISIRATTNWLCFRRGWGELFGWDDGEREEESVEM